MRKLLLLLILGLLLLTLTACNTDGDNDDTSSTNATTTQTTTEMEDKKPVIYLYPTEATDVVVQLDYKGELITTYPPYDGQWRVRAYPDGTIVNKADGKTYSYLFWEGKSDIEYDFSKGFVVKGADTATFLQDKLSEIGLLPHEYNEFIVYWLPQMEQNDYNLIAFQTDRYTDNAKLSIEPQPDSVLRVFMAYRPLEEPVAIEEQLLQPFERKGFTVVEWGGCQIE